MFILISFVLNFCSTVLAKETSVIKSPENYKLYSSNAVQSSIIPLEFDNEEEYLEFIKNLKDIDISYKVDIQTGKIEEKDNINNISRIYYQPSYRSWMRSGSYTSYQTSGLMKLNLTTNYTYENRFPVIGHIHPNQDYFTSSSASFYLTGVTVGVNICSNSTYSNISSNGRQIYSVSTGTLQYYPILSSIGKIVEVKYRIDHTINK